MTTVSASEEFKQDRLWLNKKVESLDSERTKACLTDLRRLRAALEQKNSKLPKLSTFGLHIVSENNFPTAAGLASSAAGFAAFVVAIAKLYELPQDMSELSKIARKGSGSACRSLFGGFVAWEMGADTSGEDSKAVEVAPLEHWPNIKAAILVVNDDKKDVPSTSGMQSTVATSLLFEYRISEVVPKRFTQMKEAILKKDFQTFGELTMKDSNSFHAVCLDSFPPIFYLKDTSQKIIKLIHALNASEGQIIAAYTFDAGPNAVIYYESQNEKKVLGYIYKNFDKVSGWEKIDVSNLDSPADITVDTTLQKGVSRIILTEVGPGPENTEESLVNEKGFPEFLSS